MTASLVDLAGVPVFVCAPDGPALDERLVLDLIADASYQEAELVALPAERCGDDFFRLSSRLAGEVVQKFVNYRLRLAIVGDISDHLAGSDSLRAFVNEANRGNQLWFVTDQDALAARLAERPGPTR